MVVDVGRWNNQSVNVGLMLLLSEYCGRLFRFAERTGRRSCSDVDVNRDVNSNSNECAGYEARQDSGQGKELG